MEKQEFAGWFKRQLRSRDWTQADFARRSGCATGTISNWARGTRVPDPPSCDVIADIFGIDRDDVLDRAGHRPAAEPVPDDDPRHQLHALIDHINWRDVDSTARKMIVAALEDVRGDQVKQRRRASEGSMTR